MAKKINVEEILPESYKNQLLKIAIQANFVAQELGRLSEMLENLNIKPKQEK